jgi:hypothetical protein
MKQQLQQQQTQLTHSTLATSQQNETFEMPTCEYSLHLDTPDGPPVKFSIVGQKIVHKWMCDNCNTIHFKEIYIYFSKNW